MPMPGVVAQGPTLRRISVLSRRRKVREEALADLKKAKISLLEIAERYGVVRTSQEKQHLGVHFLSQQGWWPEIHDQEKIVRRGLITALEIAAKDDLPLEVYWVCAGSHFEAAACRGRRQVTLMLLTPPRPAEVEAAEREMELAAKEPIWITKHGPAKHGEKLVAEDGDVVTVRLRTREAPK